MSLHTIPNETLSLEALWKKIKKYYDSLQVARAYEMGRSASDLTIFGQIQDDGDNGEFFTFLIIETRNYEEFIEMRGSSLRDVLEGIIPKIEYYLENHVPYEEQEEDE